MPHYAPYYCEENVWWLARDLPPGTRAEVAIVSNPGRSVAVWAQRAATSPEAAVIWDYHVVLAVLGPMPEVHDPDCALGPALPARAWLDASFRPTPSRLEPRFRVIAADAYVRLFSSDRSHMRDEHGQWRAPPPPWPPIGSGPSNLMRLVDLEDPIAGDVVGLDDLRRRWAAS